MPRASARGLPAPSPLNGGHHDHHHRTAAVPVFPLSMFGPVHLGIDENGEQVHVDLAERNMLLGGEPGGGKSNP